MTAERYYVGPPPLTPFVRGILIINVAVFALGLLLNRFLPSETLQSLFVQLSLVPAQVLRLKLWQLLTHAFLHANLMHILFNMLTLYFFGPRLENRFGSGTFGKLYLVSAVGAGVCSTVFAYLPFPTASPGMAVIGASGAIFGILAVYAAVFPNDLIYIFMMFPVRAKWAVLIFIALNAFAMVSGTGGHVANQAHLGGVFVGYLYYRYFISGGRGGGRLWPRRRRLSPANERFREIARGL